MQKGKKEEGKIIETLGGLRYRVELDSGIEVIAYLSGKMKRNKIQIMLGDRVDVLLDPYGGKATNRIVWRR
jgi:translation initiation factor IF-1